MAIFGSKGHRIAKEEGDPVKRRIVYHILFWGYCALMAWLLFGRTRYDITDGYWNTLSQHLSLQPLHAIRLFANVLLGDYSDVSRRSAIVNLVGNIIMFLPLGFFPSLLWKAFQKWWKMLLWGTGIIACVELIQLFALVGNCDIDDLLLNLAGILMGYGLCSVLRWIKGRRRV